MDAETYQKLAARTLIDGPDFEISDRDFMVVWCAVGSVGEAGEIYDHYIKEDDAGIGKEIGDEAWYLAGICTKLGISFGDVTSEALATLESNPKGCISLLRSAAVIAELIKKGIFHQHGLDVGAIRSQVVFSVQCLMNVCSSVSISFFDVLADNISKLRARYPDGWDHTRSGIREGEAR